MLSSLTPAGTSVVMMHRRMTKYHRMRVFTGGRDGRGNVIFNHEGGGLQRDIRVVQRQGGRVDDSVSEFRGVAFTLAPPGVRVDQTPGFEFYFENTSPSGMYLYSPILEKGCMVVIPSLSTWAELLHPAPPEQLSPPTYNYSCITKRVEITVPVSCNPPTDIGQHRG